MFVTSGIELPPEFQAALRHRRPRDPYWDVQPTAIRVALTPALRPGP